MTTTTKSIVKTEAIFSEDRQHRYLLRKEWDKNKAKAMVIMINPSTAGEVAIDYTTLYVINNLYDLDFGSVDIVNIFSNVDGSRRTKESIPEHEKENHNQILLSGEKADKIMIAWGKVGDNNKNIQERQEGILELLSPYKEKLFSIGDQQGNVGLHPLAPKIRFGWNLVKFDWKEIEEIKPVEQKQK